MTYSLTKHELQQILRDQKKEIESLHSKWLPREKLHEFESLLSSKLVKVIMGIRRSGKSTLCIHALPSEQFVYVNFDDERLIVLTTKDLQTVYEVMIQINPQAQFYIFDEIQNIDKWELFINRLKRKGLNIIVTGSNGKLLSKELATHLTGRHLSLELMPFSFYEFLGYKKASTELNEVSSEEIAQCTAHFEDYFTRGGFPEVVEGEPQGLYLRELFDKIVGRDIVQRHNVRTPKLLKELGVYMIQQSGSVISYQQLQRAFGYSSINTVRNHLNYLQESYLLYEVSAYSYKLKERSTLPKKNYACDVGMMNALSTKATDDLGIKLETLVFLHLRRKTNNIFYLKSSDHDIDFAVTEERKINSLIQVCFNMTDEKTRKREISSLLNAAKKWKVADLKIITWSNSEELHLEGVDIQVIPAWKFCLS